MIFLVYHLITTVISIYARKSRVPNRLLKFHRLNTSVVGCYRLLRHSYTDPFYCSSLPHTHIINTLKESPHHTNWMFNYTHTDTFLFLPLPPPPSFPLICEWKKAFLCSLFSFVFISFFSFSFIYNFYTDCWCNANIKESLIYILLRGCGSCFCYAKKSLYMK